MKRKIGKNGQSMVELCLIMPILIMVLLGGIVDFGYAFYNYITLQQIANDAALFAINPYTPGVTLPSPTGQTDDEVGKFVQSKVPANWVTFSASNIVLTMTTVIDDSHPTKPLYYRRVTLSYGSPLYTPFWRSVWANIPLSTSAVFQVPRSVLP